MNYENSTTRRGRVIDEGITSGTIATENMPNVIEASDPWTHDINGKKYRIKIRKLTPRECWRLMGMSDEDFEKASTEHKTFTEGDLICNAKLKGAKTKRKQEDMVIYVSSTTRDLLEQAETLTDRISYLQTPEQEKLQNVNIAIEKSAERGCSECATNIIRCGEFMETHYTLMEDKDLPATDISVLVKKGSTNIERLWRIHLEDNWNLMRLFIISTLLKQITESKIFTSTLLSLHISRLTMSLEKSGNNTVEMCLLSLLMDATYMRVSNTELYKQAGNSIVVDVLMAVFRPLKLQEVNE